MTVFLQPQCITKIKYGYTPSLKGINGGYGHNCRLLWSFLTHYVLGVFSLLN